MVDLGPWGGSFLNKFAELSESGMRVYVLLSPVIRPSRGLMIEPGQRFVVELEHRSRFRSCRRWRVHCERGEVFTAPAGGPYGIWRWSFRSGDGTVTGESFGPHTTREPQGFGER